MDREQRRTALASIAAAVVLVVLKLGTGVLTGSLALSSAGVESSGDVVAAVLTFLAIRLGARPADRDHPYGHRRVENLAALGEAAIICGGGLLITYEAVRRLVQGAGVPFEAAWYIFVVIAVAIAIDVSRIVISVRAARKYESAAFRSNAFNFAGDLAGSISVLAGLLLVATGFEQGDAIAALLVAALIFYAVGRLVRDNARALMDRAPDEAREMAEQALSELSADVALHRLRLRESGGRIFADVTVGVAPGAAVVEGHAQADEVERALRAALPGSDVVVHVEPRTDGIALRQRVLAAALAEPLVQEAHDIAIFSRDERATVSLHLKFPAELTLQDAHDAAERVEETIRALPGIDAVQTHLEPLEQPVAEQPGDAAGRDACRERVEALVRKQTGRAPEEVRVLATDAGLVLFLTVTMPDAPSLTAAHAFASELEERLRADQPELAEVVVHTQPPLQAAG
jgi:cation diffusion facilitator family transporter